MIWLMKGWRSNMSGRTAKAKRKEEKAKNDDFIFRRELMRKEFISLSKKFKIDLKPGINYGPEALLPVMIFVDMKEHYGQVTEEAKQAEAKKKSAQNGKSKTGLKTKLKV